ncbi:hypothetical protein DPMN_094234 [Dreissena polymorpha]|uniref:Uncharacterized protein n=1 Tax=Dreissena polymorpha TaxID=45954 RepID=A0A9D4L5R7_DREPO|nr:hypothetical protein DPMN_094234 [Dreissena polymorpha]
MSCVGSRSRSPGPHLIRENFDPARMLKAISGLWHTLARAIFLLRESAGNLDPGTLK